MIAVVQFFFWLNALCVVAGMAVLLCDPYRTGAWALLTLNLSAAVVLAIAGTVL